MLAYPAHQGTAPSAAPTPRTYFPVLDGVRAIAILMVIVFHMAQQGIPIPGPVILGQTGVDLFFVLSGFLITGILLKSPQRDWHEVRTFYIRRTLRIFPLYYLFLLLLVLGGSPVSTSFWLYVQNIHMALYLPINGPLHFWSLAVEEQFYLVWPFVVLFLPRAWLRPALIGMIVVALVCRPVLIHHNIDPFTFTLSRIDALAAGALLALLQASGQLHQLRSVLAGLALVSLAIIVVQAGVARHSAGLLWIQTTKFTLFAAFYTAALGLLLTTSGTALHRLLGSAPLRFIGRISYGLYIVHPVLFHLVFPRMAHQSALLRASAGLGLTFGCALLSWYGLEQHCIALKDRLAPERARFPRSAPPLTAL